MKYPDFTDAKCAGDDVNKYFFPDTQKTQGMRRKREEIEYLTLMCHGCPVYTECFNWALQSEKHGWWAGTNERQRDLLRKKLGITL